MIAIKLSNNHNKKAFREKTQREGLKSNFKSLYLLHNQTNQYLDIMAKIKGSIVVAQERCKGCEVCISACPCDVLALSDKVNGKGYHYAMMAQPDKCTGCASCAIICPDSCIVVYRQKVE